MTDSAPDFASWLAQVERGLRGKGWRDLAWTTADHFAIPPLVRAEDAAPLPHRRVESLLHARHGWQVRELIACADPRDAARRARRALERGADELEFCLDALAHDAMSPNGVADPDHDDDPFATPTPGEGGVAVHLRRDLEAMLEGLDLAKTSLWFSSGEGSLAVLVWWLRLARSRRIAPQALRGGLDVDPIEMLLSRRVRSARDGQVAACRTSPDSVFDTAAAVVHFVRRDAPGIRPLVLDAQSHHLAGASPGVELGLLLASIVEVARGLERRGLSFTELAASATVRVQVGHEFCTEIAKLRALRLCFAKLGVAFGARGAALVPRVLALTSSRFRADLYDHRTNLVRNAVAAAAAVLGGCDSLIVMPFDGQDSVAARDLARDQQHLLRAEAQLARVADAAGGSHAIEKLTHELGAVAWNVLQEIEQAGGFLAAAKSGLAQQFVRLAEHERDLAFRTRARTLVGISRYADAELGQPEANAFDIEALDEFGEAAVARFEKSVARRDRKPVEALIAAMRRSKPSQLIETALADAADEATLEDLATATWPRAGHDLLHRWAPFASSDGLAFEELRANVDACREEGSPLPTILMLSFGASATVVARADFARDLLGAGGLEALERRVDELAAATAAIAEHEPAALVLCADDEGALPKVNALRAALPQGHDGTATLVWTGKPAAELAGAVDLAMHRGADAVATLATLQERLGLAVQELDFDGESDD